MSCRTPCGFVIHSSLLSFVGFELEGHCSRIILDLLTSSIVSNFNWRGPLSSSVKYNYNLAFLKVQRNFEELQKRPE